jgi:ribose transport system ATP-binding protein
MTPLISIKDLSKSFPGVNALSHVHFELMAGEVHALVGENGAGKSTLMKIVSGVYSRDSGEILYDGERVNFLSPRAAQDAGISIIHQELNLVHHLTVAQNMFIGREPRGRWRVFLDEDKLNREAREILERIGLRVDPRAVVGGLSVAKQQMVEIAKALSHHSRVLIMDEPTAALNAAEVAELFSIVRELKAAGVGVAYISHKLEEIKEISDRVTMLRDGQYVATVPTASTGVDRIIAMMVGRALAETQRIERKPPQAEVALEVRNLCCAPLVRAISAPARTGGILFARFDLRRPARPVPSCGKRAAAPLQSFRAAAATEPENG